jgi:hypothetical protein
MTEEIAQAVERIHAEDQVPTASRVLGLLGNSNLFRKEAQRAAFLSWQHVNLLEEYDFSEERLQDTVGIKPQKLVD